MRNRLVFSSAVKRALKNGEPVVALESTILTHGLPRPINHRVAVNCERVVSEAGATAATIFLRDGKIHIGAEEDELEKLCSVDGANKVSRRDYAGTLARSGWGGTTISGTLIGAHLAGIPLMATGGLGGVHRGGEISLDVSADLGEMSRTPVAVCCSGVKKILDVGRTLEVLESKGMVRNPSDPLN